MLCMRTAHYTCSAWGFPPTILKWLDNLLFLNLKIVLLLLLKCSSVVVECQWHYALNILRWPNYCSVVQFSRRYLIWEDWERLSTGYIWTAKFKKEMKARREKNLIVQKISYVSWSIWFGQYVAATEMLNERRSWLN